VADWLKEVNRGKAPSLEEMKFTGPATNDVLGQTLQLLHAVYVAKTGCGSANWRSVSHSTTTTCA